MGIPTFSEELRDIEHRLAVLSLNQPEKDAMPKKEVHHTGKRALESPPKKTFFSLPLEVRRMIYEAIYEYDWAADGILDYAQQGLYYYKTSFPSMGLTLVCRKMYNEVTPHIYKRVRIGLPLQDWHRFFCEIGPHNTCHFQHITIDYNCSLWGGASDCWGRDEYKDNYNKWEGIFRSLYHGHVKPKSVMVYYDPCEDYHTTEDGMPVDGYQYRRCQVYEDMWFVEGIIRCFSEAWKIEMAGKFNPLWGHLLREGLDFVLKRTGDRRITLFNPDFIRPSVDLKDCIKNPDGIYDKIEKKLPESPWGSGWGNTD
ncbi:hypothetical protein GL218_06175 [Daldinia childiae]|uniref:uncharacterized protein n=1 Tax=Daldinia childiae TaxID=326645 RepID=UPI001447DD61|nr:uncharacterized protein GL218_06175 [Daldinia childiae]KAF3057084.1 hypothetical protein GL218_06175 [Daldinia childiae]